MRASATSFSIRIIGVAVLDGAAFWLVDRSQNFPLSEGAYGPHAIALLIVGAACALAALLIANAPVRATGRRVRSTTR